MSLFVAEGQKKKKVSKYEGRIEGYETRKTEKSIQTKNHTGLGRLLAASWKRTKD